MKKTISIIVALLFAISLCSCGSKNEEAESSPAFVGRYETQTSYGTPVVSGVDTDSDFTLIDTPESTCFLQIGYDYRDNTLLVTFRDSEDTYLYEDVSIGVWDEFCGSNSLGGYYNREIKGTYNCVKLT